MLLPIRPSVTRVDHTKTVEDRIMKQHLNPLSVLFNIVFLALICRALGLNKKAQLMLAYPRDAKTMKNIPPFRSYNKFQLSRKSGVYSN